MTQESLWLYTNYFWNVLPIFMKKIYLCFSEMDNVRQSLGYCPQFDALDPLLTGNVQYR